MENAEEKFKTGDRVRRTSVQGPLGTVQSVRVESIRQAIKVDETEPPSMTVTVLWDNGTVSHLVPDGLERVT